MSKVKVVLNSSGVRALLKSQEVLSVVKGEADRIASSLGSGYATDTHNAGSRNVASVYTDTPEAAAENSRNNTLLKAVSS